MIVESFKGGNKKERKKERLFKGYKGGTKKERKMENGLKGRRKEEERRKNKREKRKTVQWLEMKKQKKGCPRKDIP